MRVYPTRISVCWSRVTSVWGRLRVRVAAPCVQVRECPVEGAKMISALGSIVDYEVISPEELVEKVGDAAGTFYNFFLPSGIISKTVRKAK